MELEGGLFWRPARLQHFLGGWPLALGGLVGFFFQGGGDLLSLFFRWTLTVLIEIYPK